MFLLLFLNAELYFLIVELYFLNAELHLLNRELHFLNAELHFLNGELHLGPSIKDIRFFGPFFDLPTHPYPIFSHTKDYFR